MPNNPAADRDGPIVDFGGHMVLPGHVPDPMKALDEVVGPVHTDPDLVARRYESAGIDRVVLSQPPSLGGADAPDVRAANDALYEVLADYDQFYGLASVPTAAGGTTAAEELERCLEDGFHGGALETESGGIELDDEEITPVFEVAGRHGAPLLVHPKLHDSLGPDVLDDAYQLNAIFGREVALAESIFRVIHGGVLESFPDLTLVFHHLGGNLASMLGRIHLRLDAGRWPGQESVKPFDAFKRELDDRVYVDTSGFWGYSAPMRAAYEAFPASQILFGTDSPYEPRTPDELARLASVVTDVASEGDAAAILGGNTLELLANVEP